VRRDTKDPPRIIETRWRSKNAERLTMPVLDDAAVASFGAALSAEAAAEMFIAANTKQLKEDRFQCVLPPGKVFKTAEFVAKHIVNKHTKALEAAKMESRYVLVFFLARTVLLKGDKYSPTAVPHPSSPPPKNRFLLPYTCVVNTQLLCLLRTGSAAAHAACAPARCGACGASAGSAAAITGDGGA